jgi:putative membrane protein
MKMTSFARIASLVCVPVLFTSVAAQAASPSAPAACCDPKVDPSMTPAQFAQTIATVDMLEIKLGEISQLNASAPSVKKFGAYMVKSHTWINDKLVDVVAKEGIAIPTHLDPKHAAVATKLSGLKGASFDDAYIPAMVAGHTKVLAMVKAFAASTADPEMKKFATTITPIIAKHLERAQAVEAELKQSGELK